MQFDGVLEFHSSTSVTPTAGTHFPRSDEMNTRITTPFADNVLKGLEMGLTNQFNGCLLHFRPYGVHEIQC